jgi:hypothetical protein
VTPAAGCRSRTGLERFRVSAEQVFCIGVADSNELVVVDVDANHIEIAIPEPTFSVVEHIECFGLICFHGSNRSRQHSLGFVRSPTRLLLSESS